MPGIQFGYCLPIFAAPGAGLFRTPAYSHLDPQATLALGVLADSLGYDSLWVADHLMLGQDEAILEGWTTLSALAGATRSAKLGMIHMANLFRHPSLVAKMVATLDQLSGGRYIHFPDFGNNRREHVSYGLPWDEDTDQRVQRFIDALRLTRELWTTQGLSSRSEYHEVRMAVCEPKPVQQPHPPIWLGETNEYVLQWCAQSGQGWNTVPVSLADLETKLARLRRVCDLEHRPYDDIEKSLEIQILIAPDREALRDRLRLIVSMPSSGYPPTPEQLRRIEALGLPVPDPDPELAAYVAGETDDLPQVIQETWLAGTPDEVASRIDSYVAAGISHFMLWFVDAPGDAGLRLFASDVMGRYR